MGKINSSEQQWFPSGRGRAALPRLGISKDQGPGKRTCLKRRHSTHGTGRDKDNQEFSRPAKPLAPEHQDVQLLKGWPRPTPSPHAPLQSLTMYLLCAHLVLGFGEMWRSHYSGPQEDTMCMFFTKSFTFTAWLTLAPYYPTSSWFYREGTWGSGEATGVTQRVRDEAGIQSIYTYTLNCLAQGFGPMEGRAGV